jgi:tetratricopeptide (TPR) repeat protein
MDTAMETRTPPLLLLLLFLTASSALAGNGSVEFYRGKIAFEAGQYREAGAAFAAAGKAGYQPLQIHYWMGKTYLALGNDERAKPHLLRARRAGLRSQEISFELARMALVEGDFEAAEKELLSLPTAWTRQSRVQLLLCHVAISKGDWEMAVPSLKKAAPDYPAQVLELATWLPEDLREPVVQFAAAIQERVGTAKSPPPKATSVAAVPVAKAPQPPQDQNSGASRLPRLGGAHAYEKKLRSGKAPQVIRRWGKRGDSKSGTKSKAGPMILSRPKYQGNTSKVGN